MCARLRALWRNITSKTSERRGDSLLMGIVSLITVFVFFLIFFEKWRIFSISLEASRKVTATATSLASSHLNDSYSPIRDTTSGAFVYDGVAFEEIKDISGFYPLFVQLHDHTRQNGELVECGVESNSYLYTISNVTVMVSNAGTGSGKTLYRVEYTLTIPQGFFWQNREIVLDNQVQNGKYLNKF